MAAKQLSGQQPQIEGAVDTKVFSGQGVSQTPFFKVASVAGDTGLTLRGGALPRGLPPTQKGVFPPGPPGPRGGDPPPPGGLPPPRPPTPPPPPARPPARAAGAGPAPP